MGSTLEVRLKKRCKLIFKGLTKLPTLASNFFFFFLALGMELGPLHL